MDVVEAGCMSREQHPHNGKRKRKGQKLLTICVHSKFISFGALNWTVGLVRESGNSEHLGHPRMSSEEVFLSTRAMSDADRKLVSDLFDVRISSGAVCMVLQKHSATLFTCGQISSLRPKPVALSPEEAKMTAAQRLDSNLEKDPVISYVKLTDSGGIDTPLVTVNKQSGRAKPTVVETNLPPSASTVSARRMYVQGRAKRSAYSRVVCSAKRHDTGSRSGENIRRIES
jgi:hypothetical protein